MKYQWLWKKKSCLQDNAGDVIVSNLQWFFAVIGLAGLIFTEICLLGDMQWLGIDVFLVVVFLSCFLLFLMGTMLLLLYRFRLDAYGVTMHRLFKSRFFSWDEVKDIFITARYTDKYTSHMVQTVIFCTKRQRPYIRPESVELRNRKWAMCIDLNSAQYPADKMFAYLDKEQFMDFAQAHGLLVLYDPEAMSMLERNKRKKSRRKP